MQFNNNILFILEISYSLNCLQFVIIVSCKQVPTVVQSKKIVFIISLPFQFIKFIKIFLKFFNIFLKILAMFSSIF